MLIQRRSITLRKALCLVPKNNFPTLSTLSVLGVHEQECVHIFLCVCALVDCEHKASLDVVLIFFVLIIFKGRGGGSCLTSNQS